MSPRAAKKLAVVPDEIKLDIACGQSLPEGWTGIDLYADADICHDLFQFPWPIDDNSIAEARSSHFVEHIPHWRPGWEKDGWWLFFDEVHRILAPGATIEIHHPYSRSDRAFWDPTHERFIHEQTWYYLDKNWREAQSLDHYPTEVDFEVVLIDGVGVPDHVTARNADFQAFARLHYFNVIGDLRVVLKKR